MDNILLNSGLLGNAPKGKKSTFSESGMFVFNGYNLHNGKTRRVLESNHDDLGIVAYETYDYSRADGGNALSKYYRTKTITITMCLSADDENGLNDLIDELKFQTSKMQGYLDIIINGLVRRWEATLTSLQFGRKGYNINFLQNVVLTFECVNPSAFNLTSITNRYSGLSGNYATELNYSGKVNCYPTIYIVVQNETNLTGFQIDMNGYKFQISGEYQAGDFIIIDGETKLVKVNGTTTAYMGPFPVIEPGLNHIEISINSGAIANYDMIFIYKKLFL